MSNWQAGLCTGIREVLTEETMRRRSSCLPGEVAVEIRCDWLREEAVTAEGATMVAITDDKEVYWPSTAFVRVLQPL